MASRSLGCGAAASTLCVTGSGTIFSIYRLFHIFLGVQFTLCLTAIVFQLIIIFFWTEKTKTKIRVIWQFCDNSTNIWSIWRSSILFPSFCHGWMLTMLNGLALCARLGWCTFAEHLNQRERQKSGPGRVLSVFLGIFLPRFPVGSCLGCWIFAGIKDREGYICGWDKIWARKTKRRVFSEKLCLFSHCGANHFHFHLYVCACVCVCSFTFFPGSFIKQVFPLAGNWIYLRWLSLCMWGYRYNIQHSKLGQLDVYSFVCRRHTILSNSLALCAHVWRGVEGVHCAPVIIVPIFVNIIKTSNIYTTIYTIIASTCWQIFFGLFCVASVRYLWIYWRWSAFVNQPFRWIKVVHVERSKLSARVIPVCLGRGEPGERGRCLRFSSRGSSIWVGWGRNWMQYLLNVCVSVWMGGCVDKLHIRTHERINGCVAVVAVSIKL